MSISVEPKWIGAIMSWTGFVRWLTRKGVEPQKAVLLADKFRKGDVELLDIGGKRYRIFFYGTIFEVEEVKA